MEGAIMRFRGSIFWDMGERHFRATGSPEHPPHICPEIRWGNWWPRWTRAW